jgi:nucleotide-binding universal stress UspA family protein
MSTQTAGMIVGYDGSPDSCRALDWAAAHAQRHGMRLTVLHVVDYLGQLPGTLPTVLLPHRVEQTAGHPAQQVAAEGVHRARKSADSIDITALTHTSRVAYRLIAHSRSAALLVVGTRGHGELSGALLASVAFAVSGHARCPVVVVRGDGVSPPGPDRPIVVGVDGSPGSDAALRFAADTAAAESADLVVLAAHQSISARVWAESLGTEVTGRPFDQTAQQAAERAVEAAVEEALRRQPGLNVTSRVVTGPVLGALTSAAAGAGLLMVGTRGGGGFAGLRLGSVSRGVIHASPCPVAVIPPAEIPPA